MPSTYSPARSLSAQRAPGRGTLGERFSQRQPPGRARGVGGSHTEPPPAGVPRLRRSQPGICLPAPPGGAGLPPPPRLPLTPPGLLSPGDARRPPAPGLPLRGSAPGTATRSLPGARSPSVVLPPTSRGEAVPGGDRGCGRRGSRQLRIGAGDGQGAVGNGCPGVPRGA